MKCAIDVIQMDALLNSTRTYKIFEEEEGWIKLMNI